MKEAVERINKAIEEQESIVIFGDYDADGVTSTSVLFTYIKRAVCDSRLLYSRSI
ncbi:hypothetical protein BsIDN1_47840 [Bacillus safensis]|uniref:Single-stranded-DNA-specific exonuclease RecJ n=1 Tax=Bacillus safensis TaxID=561879 RepID=A0A5S9MHR5_BACIA|nr:hypothetical protein BsIDN1_47840 [Bacillus safensis]